MLTASKCCHRNYDGFVFTGEVGKSLCLKLVGLSCSKLFAFLKMDVDM